MPGVLSEADLAQCASPHIARAWFGAFDFPDGMKYLHNGEGNITVDGNEYIGVSDILSGRLVSIGQVEEPQFGQAAAIVIMLSGASREFIQSVHATRRQIEGRSAVISWALFHIETGKILSALYPLFPRGKMSAPSLHWQGLGRRHVSLTIESTWSSQNFAPGGRWNAAGQRGRYAGDKGLDFVGVPVSENWL